MSSQEARSAATIPERERMSVTCFAYLSGMGDVRGAARLRRFLQTGRSWRLEYDAKTDTVRNPYAR